MDKQHSWTTWWTRAQRGLGLFEKSCSKYQKIELKAIPSSQKMRIKFSAYYDSEDVMIENIMLSDSRNKKKICDLCKIPSQGEFFLDEIDISDLAKDELRIEYTIRNRCVSGFEWMDYDEFIEANKQIYALSQIDLYTDELDGCICVFGDSIVEQAHYVRVLKQELNKKNISVLNLGISGNRLLRKIETLDLSKTENEEILKFVHSKTSVIESISLANQCFGMAGIQRFKQEITNCMNVKKVIIAIGVNDLYQPDTFCAKSDELPTLKEMIDGYEILVKQSPASCLFCQITSFEGNPHYTAEKENLRRKITHCLMEEHDVVLLDDVLKDRKSLFNKDMLHPNQKAGKLVAKEIFTWL